VEGGDRSLAGSDNTEGTTNMSVFTDQELRYLRSERLLGRLATVGSDGMPHIAPVGWQLDADGETITVTGRNFAATKKFRDAAATGRAAIVIDDVLPPWQPRGVEVRGRAETVDGPEPLIRIRPTRIVSWGLGAGHTARTIRTGPASPTPGG
jgi:pyridoxamine 5'-phosphate oxidase family protein